MYTNNVRYEVLKCDFTDLGDSAKNVYVSVLAFTG